MTVKHERKEANGGVTKKQKLKGSKSKNISIHERDEGINSSGENPITFWDCSKNIDVPKQPDQIKKLHVYDFDNTLFYSPCPNPNLFNDQTIGMLANSDMLSYGGWWSEPLIFKNMGAGWDVESQRQWESFWNQDVENLLKLSYEDDETLAIIMTGRKNKKFIEFISEILESRGIKYDGLMLKKGNFNTTIDYKTQVLTDILDHYNKIEQVSIYDDRPSQLNGFQKFLNEYTEAVRPELIYNLIPVSPEVKYLEPKKERALIEELLEQHNSLVDQGKSTAKLGRMTLKRSFFFSAYIVEVDSKAELLSYLIDKFNHIFTPEVQDSIDFQLDFIPISRNRVSAALELKINEDPEVEWKITSFGVSNDDAFAVRVEPVGVELPVKTLYDPPFLTIGTKRNSPTLTWERLEKIVDWVDLKDNVTIKTRFGQVVKFRIVKENANYNKTRYKRPLSSGTTE
ncbi:hypothetical protein BN7_1472 [Wickerhamomyces ciferrii]|uniref:Swiss Army Knife RNA repair protein HAD domain-containing protein n=1 Tax=Wickerhamomyces ciferrii (strain ATCC 14091 / BCRC 22168 / CBS 111 / JCM 3599 / NBRC 0793 / NRRL Y-1031 F-60-10) TaxID=1206466 RepID=K0KLD6_WICCF|nr:uncharacterized protein BN7_1472 [Wickerhamomyces ciferrii]CCH41933.1 hypothetical protein BN7_1472 [Wickerhamomyces ciferrii]